MIQQNAALCSGEGLGKTLIDPGFFAFFVEHLSFNDIIIVS